MNTANPNDSGLRPLIPFIALLLLSIVTYIGAVNNGYVWDDHNTIESNINLRSLKNLPVILGSEDGTATGYYRPLNALSFALDYAIWGDRPGIFHFINLLFHAGAVLCGYLVLRQLFSAFVAFAAAAVFAIHPAGTETVLILSGGRSTLICIFFMLLSLQFYIRSDKLTSRAYALSVVTFALAQFTKEYAVIFPAFVIAYEYLFAGRRFGDTKAVALKLGPFLLVTACYAFIKIAVLGIRIPDYTGQSLAERLALLPNFFAVSARVLLLPYDMRVFYDEGFEGTTNAVIGGFVMMALLLMFIVLWRNKRVLFGLLFVIMPLGPVMNIIPLSTQLVALRYFYLPTLGIGILAGLAAEELGRRSGPNKKAVSAALIAALLLWYGIVTVQRVPEWRNDYTVFSKDLAINPDSYRSATNAGMWLYENGRTEEAEAALRQAYQRNMSPDIALRLGVMSAKRGDTQQAMQYYQSAMNIEKPPLKATAADRMGELLEQTEKYKEAEEMYGMAVGLNPFEPKYHLDLGILLVKEAELSHSEVTLGRAEQEIRRAIELTPSDPLAHNSMGSLYRARKDFRRAAGEYAEAVRLDPELCEGRYNFATVMDESGDQASARTAWLSYIGACENRDNEREFIQAAKQRLLSFK